jgi:hypothetical protein
MPKLDEMFFYLDRYLLTLSLVLCYALYAYLDFYKDNFLQTVVLFISYCFFTWLSSLAVKDATEFDSYYEKRLEFLEEIKSEQKLLE